MPEHKKLDKKYKKILEEADFNKGEKTIINSLDKSIQQIGGLENLSRKEMRLLNSVISSFAQNGGSIIETEEYFVFEAKPSKNKKAMKHEEEKFTDDYKQLLEVLKKKASQHIAREDEVFRV